MEMLRSIEVLAVGAVEVWQVVISINGPGFLSITPVISADPDSKDRTLRKQRP